MSMLMVINPVPPPKEYFFDFIFVYYFKGIRVGINASSIASTCALCGNVSTILTAILNCPKISQIILYIYHILSSQYLVKAQSVQMFSTSFNSV